MATGRYRFKQPLDNWSIREKLALACSVLRSGDQNWVSVSRTIRPLGEPDRSEQWFSQKNCAQQYAELLEMVETPKRKRGEKEKETVETPQLVIARKLTLERVEELREIIKKEQQEYYKLREDIEKINAGHYDKDLPELVKQIKLEAEKQEIDAIKEEKGDGDASTSTPVTLTPITEVKVKIEKEDTSVESEVISVVEETVIAEPSQTPIVTTPKKEPVSQPTTPAITPVKIPKQEIKEEKPPTTEILEEQISLIKTEPVEEVEVDILAETSDEGAHMAETSTVSVVEIETEPAETEKQEENEEINETKEENIEVLEESGSADTSTISIQEPVSVSKDVDDNPPQSPASSIISNEPDGSSARKEYIKKGKHNRGRKQGRTLKKQEQEKKDERPLASELDTSDDDEKSVSSKHGYLDITPGSPAPGIHSETEMDEKQYKLWKKSIILVWRGAANHKYAKLFLHPVTEAIAPGYSSIVYRPIDLQTIKRKIENGEIRTTVEFQRDIMLMFTNAIMYNSSDHDVYHMAMEMYNDVMNAIEQYVSTQVMLQSQTTPTGKVLRQSRRSETQTFSGSERSDKEDDPKKRRQSNDCDGGKVKKRKV